MMNARIVTVVGCAWMLGGCGALAGGGIVDDGAQSATVGPEDRPTKPTTPEPNGAAAPAATHTCDAPVRPNIPKGEVCIVAGNGQLAYVPLDGSPPVEGPSVFTSHMGNASLGLHAGALYMCNGNVTRVWMADGYAESTDVPCTAVTANHGGIWVVTGISGGRVEHYPNDAALVARRSDASAEGTNTSRVAVRGESDELSFAWHSTHELYVGRANEPKKAIALDGYDGWIQGLDQLEDGRFVIGTWFTENELRVFDAAGKPVKSISLADTGIHMAEGIVCGDGEALANEAASCSAPAAVRRTSRSIAGTCGGESSNYTEATSGPNEVHVIGVYEGQYDGPTHGACWEGQDPNLPGLPPCPPVRPRGKISVHVKASARPIVLVLSTYEPVDYTLTVDAGAKIAKITTQGYYESSVTGAPPGTPVERIADSAGAYGWEPEHNTGGSDFQAFIAGVRKREGAEASFHGCYAGDHFEVPFE